MALTRHQYRIYVKATPAQVWQGITDPAFTSRYFHRTSIESTFEAGAPVKYLMADGSDAVEGVIEVAEPPHRLVMTWRFLYDAGLAEEPPGRVEWLLTEAGDGMTRVDVSHGDLARSPRTWAHVKDGWVWILDNLKTLLETGEPLPDETANAVAEVADAEASWHRTLAINAYNSTWEIIGQDRRTAADHEELLRRAYAAAYHWDRAAGRTPINEARSLYMLAKAHLLAGVGERALHYADACMAATLADGAGDFDLAYAHEIRARALKAVGQQAEAEAEWAAALAVPIAEAEDKAILDGDLADGL